MMSGKHSRHINISRSGHSNRTLNAKAKKHESEMQNLPTKGERRSEEKKHKIEEKLRMKP